MRSQKNEITENRAKTSKATSFGEGNERTHATAKALIPKDSVLQVANARTQTISGKEGCGPCRCGSSSDFQGRSNIGGGSTGANGIALNGITTLKTCSLHSMGVEVKGAKGGDCATEGRSPTNDKRGETKKGDSNGNLHCDDVGVKTLSVE